MTRAANARVPGLVWLLTVGFGFWLAFSAVLVPLYTTPDEASHVDMVLGLREGWGYPDLGERGISDRVIASYPLVGYEGSRVRTPQTAFDAIPRGERPAFADIGGEGTGGVNLLAAHPPLYYAVLAAATTFVTGMLPGGPALLPLDVVVAVMRLLGGVALIMWLPLLAFLAGRRLTGSMPVALGAAVVPITVPHLTKLGGAVNNDNLLTLLFAVLAVHIAHVLRGDTSWSRAAKLGVVAALALLTKGYALFLPLTMIPLFAVIAWRRRALQPLWSGTLALAVAGVLSGWWWLRNLVMYGNLQPPGSPWVEAPADFEPSFSAYAIHLGRRLVESSWGWSGLDIDPLPILLSWVGFVLTAICVVGALVTRRRRGGVARVDLWLMLSPLLGILVLVLVGTWQVYAYTGVHSGQQGRYLFPGAAGLAVVAAVGGFRLLRDHGRWFPLLALLLAALLQGATTIGVLLDWWGLPGTIDGSFGAILAWSPWPPAITVGLPVTALTLFGIVTVRLWLLARSRPATPPTSPSPQAAAGADVVEDAEEGVDVSSRDA